MAIKKIKVKGVEHELQTTIANVEGLQVQLNSKVPTSITVNGYSLVKNITLLPKDLKLDNVVNTGDSATPVSGGTTKFTTGGAYIELAKKVNTSTTINGKALTGNISLTYSDVGAAPSSHNQAASTITAGTLGGQVVANATSVATVGTKQVRNIYAGTAGMTAGSTALTAGDIYLQYE
jgi:hypothetical protein